MRLGLRNPRKKKKKRVNKTRQHLVMIVLITTFSVSDKLPVCLVVKYFQVQEQNSLSSLERKNHD